MACTSPSGCLGALAPHGVAVHKGSWVTGPAFWFGLSSEGALEPSSSLKTRTRSQAPSRGLVLGGGRVPRG